MSASEEEITLVQSVDGDRGRVNSIEAPRAEVLQGRYVYCAVPELRVLGRLPAIPSTKTPTESPYLTHDAKAAQRKTRITFLRYVQTEYLF